MFNYIPQRTNPYRITPEPEETDTAREVSRIFKFSLELLVSVAIVATVLLALLGAAGVLHVLSLHF